MQLAAFLDPGLAQPGKRDGRTKIRQMRAGQALASNWSHEQMLEAYFNLVPLRGEAQGLGAGAQTLFGKQPAQLNRTDAALFAGPLHNPPPPTAAPALRPSHNARKPRWGTTVFTQTPYAPTPPQHTT